MKQFDADQKSQDGSLDVTIGGKKFVGREPTLAQMKQMADAAPPDPDKDASEIEQLKSSIDSVYPQLEVILTDPETGAAPPKEFVEEHLSMRQAGDIIKELMGDAGDANPH